MKRSRLLCAVCACLTTVSIDVNASILNTLNNVDYEWMEFSETLGLSRNEVTPRLADPNDVLYGYEYASRELVESLFYSYTTWDGVDGYHGNSGVIQGEISFLTDFGTTASQSNPTDYWAIAIVDEDNRTVQYNLLSYASFYYGVGDECDGAGFSCIGYMGIISGLSGPVAAFQVSDRGWDATGDVSGEKATYDHKVRHWSSLLVRTAPVPIPPALWLFGSGLLGLVGIARKKSA